MWQTAKYQSWHEGRNASVVFSAYRLPNGVASNSNAGEMSRLIVFIEAALVAYTRSGRAARGEENGGRKIDMRITSRLGHRTRVTAACRVLVSKRRGPSVIGV